MTAATHRAVFLSYASQDAEAPRRIDEGLRAAARREMTQSYFANSWTIC